MTSPIARKTEQKMMVRMTNQVFQSWFLLTVATPKNMKMTVSEDEDSIFMAYLTVVWDLCDMLAST